MNASLGYKPSYIWRSMLWSRDIIELGSCWRVGNGESINTRRDFWIPGLAGEKIKSNLTFEGNTQVQSLINSQDEWKEEALNSRFLPYEVDAIRRIPIMGHDVPDRRYLILEKKGTYTVKTGYGAAFQDTVKNDLHSDKVCSSKKDHLWKALWNLELPPKVKIFMWKIGQNIIATEANIVMHHVLGNPRCVICGFFWADTTHSLFFCQGTTPTWKTTEW